ncbi:hypothetical protein JCM3766R1_001482, partial [Sporobolomyces carnicolor]
RRSSSLGGVANKKKKSRRILESSPYRTSPTWRRSRRVGRLLDRFVGVVWCLVMLFGFNRDARWGVVNLASIAVAGSVWRYGGGGNHLLAGWKWLS